MANYYFVIKNSQLLIVDLRIMPVMEIIKHKIFALVKKIAKSAYGIPANFVILIDHE